MSTHILDHIVHLTPPGTVEQVSQAFRKLGFDVISGGKHADGLTYNALISLSDGVYLELIAFVTSPPDPSHRWGSLPPQGWIEYAHRGLEDDVATPINARAKKDGSGVVYKPGEAGGRQTPDGKVLKWRVTFPERKTSGFGKVPFFCQDLTPRNWRVPPASIHPSTAKGIAYVKVIVKRQDEFETLSKQFTTILAISNTDVPIPEPARSSGSRVAAWMLATPSPIEGLYTQLVLSLEEDSTICGIAEVGFWVDKDRGGAVESPYGKLFFVPLP